MFLTTIVGCPGRYLVRNGASRRPVRSVPPPAAESMIIEMVLPSNEGVCAPAASHASATASQVVVRKVVFERLLSIFASILLLPCSLAIADFLSLGVNARRESFYGKRAVVRRLIEVRPYC